MLSKKEKEYLEDYRKFEKNNSKENARKIRHQILKKTKNTIQDIELIFDFLWNHDYLEADIVDEKQNRKYLVEGKFRKKLGELVERFNQVDTGDWES